MPGFDPEIGKLAQRVLINPRRIDYQTGVFASKVTRRFFFLFHLYILFLVVVSNCHVFFVLL